MRKPLVAGNWKMHNTTSGARTLAEEVRASTSDLVGSIDLVLAPPHTALAAVADAVAGSGIGVAAQDMHWADKGALTGAISPVMVAEFAHYVIVGHSERRSFFHESDADVNRKVHAAFAHDLLPILCVGETLAQRDAEQTDEVVTVQLAMALDGLAQTEAMRLVVAYEPVWAIGTGLPCDAVEAQRVGSLIRRWVSGACGGDPAARVRVLYGGSVRADNAAEYFRQPDIDGALVGGASLEASGFAGIARASL